MPYLKLDQGVLHYRVYGEASETVAMMCGIGFSSRYYDEFCKHLSQYYQVVCLDHRRMGLSTAPADWNMTTFDYAADMRRVMDHLRIENFHAAGESYGGMMAMSLAIIEPQRVKTLSVINSSIAGNFRRLKVGVISRFAHGFAINRDKLADHLVAKIISRKVQSEHPEVVRRFRQIFAEERMPFVTLQKQSVAAMRLHISSELKGLKIPTVVVYGDDDNLVPNSASLRIHRLIPSSQLIKVSDGGHHLCGEQPEEIAKTVADFINIT